VKLFSGKIFKKIGGGGDILTIVITFPGGIRSRKKPHLSRGEKSFREKTVSKREKLFLLKDHKNTCCVEQKSKRGGGRRLYLEPGKKDASPSSVCLNAEPNASGLKDFCEEGGSGGPLAVSKGTAKKKRAF